MEILEHDLRGALARVGHRREAMVKEKVEQRLCVVCQEMEKCVLLLPCRHLCLCEGCSQKKDLSICPLCRRGIAQKIGVYS